jgi:hypothetical protein
VGRVAEPNICSARILSRCLVSQVAGSSVRRADQLEGCAEGSREDQEFEAIADAIEAYEVKRWPEGKVPGGKG